MRRIRTSSRVQATVVALAPAVLLCLLAQLEVWTAEPRSAAPWLAGPLSAVATLALVARRRAPVVVAVAAVLAQAATTVLTGGGAPLAASLALLLAVFAAARWAGTRAALAAGALALLAATVRDVVDPRVDELDIALDWLLLSSVWVSGHALGRRSRAVSSLEQEAERLRRERDERARTAVAAERARLARELHDVVAHSISVVAVQAGAARWVLEDEKGPVHEALVTIERTSREALAELRRLLEVLRAEDGSAEHAPQRGLADLPSLVEQVRAAGQPLSLHLDAPAEPLPPGIDLAAYRIVQEAVTNVLKHAPGAPAAVAVRCLPAAVEVEVTNGTAPGRRGRGEAAPSGHGLLGMRERVALYGGDLSVGVDPARGFRVRARLPLQAVPA